MHNTKDSDNIKISNQLENENQIPIEITSKNTDSNLAFRKDYLYSGSIIISALIIAGALINTTEQSTTKQNPNIQQNQNSAQISELEEKVLPSDGVILPVVWGDLGAKLVSTGVIDAEKLKAVYEQRGTFTDEYKALLLGDKNGNLKITSSNAGYLLNLLWALGLGNKNTILETGEMSNPEYGGAKNFASTGGWTIAKGNPMDHYSKHVFFTLTPEQQALVDKVSRGIFRPCCGNSTHFPDCNHGMAMLGLLELMASQNVSERDMWKTALSVNSYWFPNNYLTIATYMQNKGTDWKDVNPQEMLGANYSSSRGNATIASQVTAPQSQSSGSGSGCGVDAGAPVAPAPKQQGGCGI
ncbi:MAG: hypothetical protein Q8L47_04705 [bacterium]|nr:hypothetical protein [bacterium]